MLGRIEMYVADTIQRSNSLFLPEKNGQTGTHPPQLLKLLVCSQDCWLVCS